MTQPLRIGFASIYSWRPHVEHLYFLATLAEQAGQTCFFLTCDADLPACYTRELRNIRPDWQECIACRIGGLRSFTGQNVSSLGKLAVASSTVPQNASGWARSSASTLGRFESDTDFESEAFQAIAGRLTPTVQKAYSAARQWIELNRLNAVCVFNGRMDATRAIFEAARDAGVRVVSVERTWFGNGLQLLPDENCLGLRSVDSLVKKWSEHPLTDLQARRAASYVAARFTGSNQTEWRAYNVQAREKDWPIPEAGRRILLLPGSRNEIWGHPDWESQWPEPVAAYDAVMARFSLKPSDMLLRCHPNWGEKIGKADGHMAESYYTDWARARGIQVIASTDTISTMSLIAQSDAVVLASGSAALEAGVLGKQVIATAPSIYQSAGLRTDATSAQALSSARLHVTLDQEEQIILSRDIRRKTLRFGYTMAYRVAQYARHVLAESSSRYHYVAGADPERFINLLRTGQLHADDATFADDTEAEEQILDAISLRDWQALATKHPLQDNGPRQQIRRRWLFRPIDSIRNAMPVGDR